MDPVLLGEETLTKVTLLILDRSEILVCRWRVVCPTYDAKQHRISIPQWISGIWELYP